MELARRQPFVCRVVWPSGYGREELSTQEGRLAAAGADGTWRRWCWSPGCLVRVGTAGRYQGTSGGLCIVLRRATWDIRASAGWPEMREDQLREDLSGGRLHSVTRIPAPFSPLWHADYFELKATETLLAQEKLLPSLNYLEELWGLAHN